MASVSGGSGAKLPSGPMCPNGHSVAPGTVFCKFCGAPIAAEQFQGKSNTSRLGFRENARTWTIAGAVGVVVIAAVAAFALTSSSPPPSKSSKPVTIHSTLTASHRAIDRCGVVIAAAVGNIQGKGAAVETTMAAKLKRSSWLYQAIIRSNDYLMVAKQRVHPQLAAIQQTAQHIDYVCARRVQTIAVEAKQGSTLNTAVARTDFKDFLTSIAVGATVSGLSSGTLHYFAGTQQYASVYSGVTGVANWSGLTGLTGWTVTGTSGGGTTGAGTTTGSPEGVTAPGGFTGVTGSTGYTGGQQGTPTGSGQSGGPTGFTPGQTGGGPAGPS